MEQLQTTTEPLSS